MTEPTRRVTISFAVPSAAHAVIGAILMLLTLAAWWVHFALPASNTYQPTAADIANLAGSVTLAFWLFCVVQRNRSDAEEFDERATAAIAEAEAREKRLLAAFREVAEEVAENRGSIKELQDSVDEAIKAVEALQNCYLREGTLLMLPSQRDADEGEQARHDPALRA